MHSNEDEDMYYAVQRVYSDDLQHHGILGMKWGIRRYQNEDGSYTELGKKHYGISEDSAVTKRVKEDYKKLSDKEFLAKYHGSKRVYARRVRRYGDPYKHALKRKQNFDRIKKNIENPLGFKELNAEQEAAKKAYDHNQMWGIYDPKVERKWRELDPNREQKQKIAKAVAIAGGVTLAVAATYVIANRVGKSRVDQVLKAGTKVGRVSVYDDVADGAHYFLEKNKKDALKYEGMFGKTLFGSKNKITGELASDIKIPSIKNAAEIMKSENGSEAFKTMKKIVSESSGSPLSPKANRLIENAKSSIRRIENGSTDLKDYETVYKAFGFANMEATNKARNEVFDMFKKHGYGGLVDFNDLSLSGFNSKNPLIIFEGEQITNKTVKQIEHLGFKQAVAYADSLGSYTIPFYMMIGGGKAAYDLRDPSKSKSKKK